MRHSLQFSDLLRRTNIWKPKISTSFTSELVDRRILKKKMESIKHKMEGLIKEKEEAVERAVNFEQEKKQAEDKAKEVLC